MTAPPRIRIVKKVCVLGDFAVGKTSLIRRFVLDLFDDRYITTMGTKITKKQLTFGDTELSMQIWDIVGNIIYRKLQAQYFRGSDGAFVVCDVTRKETVDNISQWIDHYLTIAPAGKIIFLGNKADLLPDTKAIEAILGDHARRQGTSFYLTSALSGTNVENAFADLGRRLLSRVPPR